MVPVLALPPAEILADSPPPPFSVYVMKIAWLQLLTQ
jgi:hypothetical protein